MKHHLDERTRKMARKKKNITGELFLFWIGSIMIYMFRQNLWSLLFWQKLFFGEESFMVCSTGPAAIIGTTRGCFKRIGVFSGPIVQYLKVHTTVYNQLYNHMTYATMVPCLALPSDFLWTTWEAMVKFCTPYIFTKKRRASDCDTLNGVPPRTRLGEVSCENAGQVVDRVSHGFPNHLPYGGS